MTYSNFLQIILSYKKFSEDISSLYDIGFDLIEGKYNLSHPIETMLEASITSVYGNEGWEWVSWFIYESEYGQKDFSGTPTYERNEDGTGRLVESSIYGARDENGNPICYSYDSLWEYLEKNCKVK
jgi:hypothetical protein